MAQQDQSRRQQGGQRGQNGGQEQSRDQPGGTARSFPGRNGPAQALEAFAP